MTETFCSDETAMAELSPIVTACHEGGNTKPPRDVRAKGWCFTINNFTEAEYKEAHAYCHSPSIEYFVMGREVGAQGTPHIQGYIAGKNVIRFSTLRAALPRAHWEVAKGNKMANFAYCTKSGDYVSNIVDKEGLRQRIKDRILARDYKNVQWRPWQELLLAKVRGAPCPRTIMWFWDEEGNKGKSFFSKFLKLSFNTIIADGKKDNVFNQLNNMLNEGIEPQCIVLDIPRHGRNYMNYGLIEQLKDGCIYSGKYEGGECIIDHAHVIIFANFEPEYEKFSADRWDVHKIE